MLKMMTGVSIAMIFASVAHAQEMKPPVAVPSCIEQDYVSIEDHGEYAAIVTYSNSKESCSTDMNWVYESPNGIKVRVQIITGTDGQREETINLFPLYPSLQSYPPYGFVVDGEKMEFLIQGGLS